jgi:threonylcarbamoyladenosine tRNA methylthiotransferase MtaB
MHRWYRAAHYAEHVNLIHEMLPDAAIGADVIAGYPGETDADHRETLEFIERMPLSYLHVFSFSLRPGTEGATLPKQVDAKTIRARARELRAQGERKQRAFHASQIGKRMRVLTLVTRSNRTANSTVSSTRAVSSNYLDLRIAGTWPANRWLDVETVSASGGEIIAEPLPPSASAFEDHLSQGCVRAVGDAEGNGCDAEAPGEFVRASV